MEFEDLKTVVSSDGERAVSPVIGVILMVAITVILAAVIGTFVLGLGSQVSSTAPQASFAFKLTNSSANVSITHDGGDAIAADTVNVSATATFDVNGTPTDDESFETLGVSGDVTAGDQVEVQKSSGTWKGETIRIVWHDTSSDETATIGKFEP